jgi:phage repressor protein C with HTH and peptisase S24 domain
MKAGGIVKEKRKERGWSQQELANRVGVSQVAIKKIESGETVKSKHFPKIAQLLDIDLAELDPALSSTRIPTAVEISSMGKKSSVHRLEQEQILGRYDLPVFGTAQGGPGVLVLSSQPFRVIARPHNLQGIENAFGILITGNSMSPEYREGDIAYVDPHIPPRAGDACLFQSERHGSVEALIKYLDKSPHASDEVWHVRQQTPDRKFTLKKAEWQKCYVLVGKQSGR